MTEDEAKTKWCPFSRVRGFASEAAVNRPFGVDPEDVTDAGCCCIGSACMAWRTRHQWMDNAQEQPGWVSYAPYAFEPGPGQEREDGFCGLAGAPQ